MEAKEEVIKEIKQGPNRLETKEDVIILGEYRIMPYNDSLSTRDVNRNKDHTTPIKLPLVTVVQLLPQIEALFMPPLATMSNVGASSTMHPYVKHPLILIFKSYSISPPPLKLTLRAVVQVIPQIAYLASSKCIVPFNSVNAISGKTLMTALIHLNPF